MEFSKLLKILNQELNYQYSEIEEIPVFGGGVFEEKIKSFEQALYQLQGQLNSYSSKVFRDFNGLGAFHTYRKLLEAIENLIKFYEQSLQQSASFTLQEETLKLLRACLEALNILSKVTNTPILSVVQPNPVMTSEEKTDIVIITALPEERDAVLAYLDSPEQVGKKGRFFYKASIKTNNANITYQAVLLCLPAMGNLQAAVATQQAIAVWNPSQIILTGIAGGIKKGEERYLGDILVGEQLVYYELGKQSQTEQGETKITRRYEVYRPARVLFDTAKSLSPENWVMSVKASRPDGTTNRVIPQVHFGVVASGEKVITDPDLTSELQSDWSKLVGVEMEGVGAALAAYESDLPGILLVKGICDWADGTKNDEWHEYAASSAAAFVMSLLKSAPFESKVKPQPIRKDLKQYSGRIKLRVCSNLDNWEDLADWFAIPPNQRRRFDRGREAQGVWEWLEARGKLGELKAALESPEINRRDLANQLDE